MYRAPIIVWTEGFAQVGSFARFEHLLGVSSRRAEQERPCPRASYCLISVADEPQADNRTRMYLITNCDHCSEGKYRKVPHSDLTVKGGLTE